MEQLARLSGDALTSIDRAALKEVARRLWPVHRKIAAEWSNRLMASIPPSVSNDIALPMVKEINAAFLALIFQHVEQDRLPELYETYYEMNRRLIEADLMRPAVERTTLDSLYTSAQVSMEVVEKFLGDEPRLLLAYTKLGAQLMMLLGRAYSDCRELHVQRSEEERSNLLRQARDELEARVQERTLALTRLNEALAKEVAERRHAEESVLRERDFADATLDSLPGVFYLFNEDSRFLRWNKNFETVSEYPREEIAQMTPLDFFDAADQARVAGRIGEALEAGHATVEADFVSKSGKRRPYFFTGRLVLLDGVPCVVGMGIDISERKRAEQALQERTAELTRSNAELEQFAYVASHDLQEPLRAVATYTQLLAQRYSDQLDDDAEGIIGRVTNAVHRMQTLIQDLLTYSRVDTRASDFRMVSCETVLQEVLDNLQTAVTETAAKVSHDPLPTVLADEVQLRQLFQNLIGNALKFHGQETPRVHLSAVTQRGHWVFSVRDNGIGIDPQYVDRIFVIFQRLHTRRAYPGTGVGLAICKKIVERHGGRIWVDSRPGNGAEFVFTLPIR
jgi:PAS domain S-box-containing protein